MVIIKSTVPVVILHVYTVLLYLVVLVVVVENFPPKKSPIMRCFFADMMFPGPGAYRPGRLSATEGQAARFLVDQSAASWLTARLDY